MATVNGYTASKIDALIAGRSPVGHTHSLADVGIGPWVDWTSQVKIWSISGGSCDLGAAGSSPWANVEYRLIDDMMFYKGQFTWQAATSLVAARYVGISMPYPATGSRQGGNVTVVRSGKYIAPRTTQYYRMSGATPDHPVMVFPNFPGGTADFALPSDGWTAGDVVAWNMFVRVSL